MTENWISLKFFTHKNLRIDETILAIFNKVIKFGYPLIPKRYNLGRVTQRKYKKFKLEDAIDYLRVLIPSYDLSDSGFSFATFSDENGFYYKLDFSRRSFDGFNQYGRKADPNLVSIDLDVKFFESEEFCDRFIDLSKEIYEFVSPAYGQIHDVGDALKLYDSEIWIKKVYGTAHFYMIYWTNFLSPEGVSIYGGWDKIKDSPCYKVEKLDDGGAMIQLTPTPLNPDSKGFRYKQNEVLSYFGLPVIDEEYFKRINEKKL